jgi:hypothetical protein
MKENKTNLRDFSDDHLLDTLERAAFGYFLSHYNPANGLVADRSVTGSPCSIAVVGFALSSHPAAVERCSITRDDAVDLCYSQRNTFAESAVQTTNTTASAATSPMCANHGSPFHIPSISDTA